MSALLERNKDLVIRLVEIVNARDLERLKEITSGSFPAQARRWIAPFRDSFPDFQMEVVDVIAEGDKVVGHFKCSGTDSGGWLGRTGSGRRFSNIDGSTSSVSRTAS